MTTISGPRAPRGNELKLLNKIKTYVDSAPSLAGTIDTFNVASQGAMLALTAQKGDLAVRSDLNQTFILQGTSASTLGDWKALPTLIAGAITSGDVTHAPTGAAVFTALGLKAAKNIAATSPTAIDLASALLLVNELKGIVNAMNA